MTIEQLITLSASLGTLVTAGLAFWSVLQVNQQRELSYLPDLVISRMYFKGSHSSDFKTYFGNSWIPDPAEKIESEDCFIFYLLLRNVGLGAAKNISVEWSFHIDEIVSQLNNFGHKMLPSTHFAFEAGKISIRSERLGNQGLHSWHEQRTIFVEYLLPIAVQKEPVKLSFPILFTQLCSFLYFFHEQNNEQDSMHNFPTLRAKIKYFDLGGKGHKTDFEIKVQLHEAVAGRIVGGYLDPKKLS